MPDDHFAIVIGISRYPGFTDPPANLQGPENDVEAMRAWLASDIGGGLPADNIKVIRTSDFPMNPREPGPTDLDDLGFLWLEGLAQKNSQAGQGLRVGSRLYLYMSGHGVSSASRQACLLTANAMPRQTTANICANSWLDYLKTANYFNEFVLIFDACMDRARSVVPMPAPLEGLVGGAPVGPLFEAFAAMTPLKTVEMIIPEDGKVHGIFTWAFLDGLRGAAVTQTGTVTGQSMATWLRAALRGRMTVRDLQDPEISKKPEIAQESARLVLARSIAPLTFGVTCTFAPDAVGKTGRVWSGDPVRSREFAVAAKTVLDLMAGLHLIEVAAVGIRQGIAVIRTARIEVRETGAPVLAAAPGTSFSLQLPTAGSATTIEVENARFEPVQGFPGPTVPVDFGLYRAQFFTGPDSVERVFLIDRDIFTAAELSAPAIQGMEEAVEAAAMNLPQIASAVPFKDGRFSHETHAEILAVPQPRVTGRDGAGEGEIFVVARTWTDTNLGTGIVPWDKVQVLDAKGNVVVDLAGQGKLKAHGDPLGYCLTTQRPGTYFLRYPLVGGAMVEQSLIVAPGWRTEVYLLHLGKGGQPRLAVLMHRSDGLVDPDRTSDEELEVASEALASGRSMRKENLIRFLDGKFTNPIRGIIGAHLFRRQRSDLPVPYDLVVTNLRQLVGNDHPDIEALSLECDDRNLRAAKPFRAPPVYEASWDMMVEASRANPALVPQSLWNRVSVQSTAPPYFAWSVDLSTRRNHRSALRDAALLNQTRTAAPVARADVAEVQAVVIGVIDDSPAGAAQGLESIAADLGPSAATEDPGAVPVDKMSSLQSFARANMLPPSALAALLKRR